MPIASRSVWAPSAWIIPTDEELMIVQHTVALVRPQKRKAGSTNTERTTRKRAPSECVRRRAVICTTKVHAISLSVCADAPRSGEAPSFAAAVVVAAIVIQWT